MTNEKTDKQQQLQIRKTLRAYGLSDNEIDVYLAAIKLDETSPYELAKLTGIARTTVYDVITDLSLKGLLALERSDGFTKQQTKIIAKNPSVLREKLREKRKQSHMLEVDLVSILPSLKDDFYGENAGAAMQFFPGPEGAKQVNKMINDVDVDLTKLVFTNLMPMDSLGMEEVNRDVDVHLEQTYTHKQKTSKQKTKEIVPNNDWAKHVISYQVERNPQYLQVRDIMLVDNPIFSQYCDITVVADQVFAVCTEGNEAWGYVMSSKAYADSMRAIHQTMWRAEAVLTLDEVRGWGSNQFYQAAHHT